jgi:3-hydroxymyristoyl/3-hydroxydecanoyl-(acyl carrier protein) dehydratase
MSMILDRTALAERVPHRGANIIPDSLTISDDGESAVACVRVAADDPHGRTIFGRDDGRGGRCWNEPFLGELVALTGVPLLGQLAETGRVSVFSMISRVAFSGLAPLDAEVEGRATISRRRGDFTQFNCSAWVGSTQVMDAEVLSGAAAMSEIASGPRQAGCRAGGEAIEPFAWKHPALTFADAVVEEDDGRLVLRYQYPEDHPFVAGHFPGAPLMMGVTQWGALADAAWLLATRRGRDRICVDGSIARADGSSVVDVRDLEMVAGEGGVPSLLGSKRVAFRDVVRPGDGIVITVNAKA